MYFLTNTRKDGKYLRPFRTKRCLNRSDNAAEKTGETLMLRNVFQDHNLVVANGALEELVGSP